MLRSHIVLELWFCVGGIRAGRPRHDHRHGQRQHRRPGPGRVGQGRARRDQLRAHRHDLREGGYTITQLPVGRYVVIITANGFQTTTFDNIEVTAGSTVRVDGKLAVGGLQDAVTVKAEAKQIQTDSVKVTTAISSKFIQDLPLVVGGQLRSPLDLSLIAPEAKTGNSGDGGRGNIVIGGGQEGGWDLTVDGVSATPGAPFEQRLWTTLNSPSVEAITEFAVDTNGFKAEFGHAGGGAVSFVSRSGTNQWRGKVFEFMRDDAFDIEQLLQQGARPAQAASSRSTISAACSADRSCCRRSTTAATRPSSSPPTRPIATRPRRRRRRSPSRPRAMYNGDFSHWRDANGNLIPIYDPATTRPNPNGPGFIRDPFPNNQIPVERFSRISREIDRAGDDAPRPPRRAQQLRLHARRPDQHQPVEQVQPQARSQPARARIASASCCTGARCWSCRRATGRAAACRCRSTTSATRTRTPTSIALNWDRVITPALLNRVTFGHNNWYQLRASFNRDQGWGTQIGLRNVPSADKLFPLIDFSDEYLDWGRSEFGGSGNYLWSVSGRSDLGEVEAHLEVRLHRPAGSL